MLSKILFTNTFTVKALSNRKFLKAKHLQNFFFTSENLGHMGQGIQEWTK